MPGAPCRFLDGQDFGVSQGIVLPFPSIEALADDLPLAGDHRTDRNLAQLSGGFSFLKRRAHEELIEIVLD